MIQRIQSIFLLLAAGAAFALFALPFAETAEPVANSAFFSDGDFDIQDHIALTVLFGLAGALALISIFLFNNRPLQMKIARLALVVNIIGIIAGVVIIMNIGMADPAGEALEESNGLGLFMPPAFILLAILALRAIKKDENLVKSMDRLR